MSNFINEAIAEKARLLKQIEMLDALISERGDKPAKIAVAPMTGSKKDAVHSLAKDCIRAAGGRANAADIFLYVTAHGIQISKDIVKNYLYKFDDLKSDGRKGFAIKK